MKNRAFVVDSSHSEHAQLRPVAVGDVRLADSFWEPRRQINRTVTIPSQYEHCEKTSRLDNFRRASGRKKCDFVGIFFNDSDIYKWLEAASWSLAADPDQKLRETVDKVIDEVAAAQQPDGYLNTYFMFERAKDRWTNLKDMHELYCAGHLIQAAVAHHRSTGDTSLLTVATKLADHICRTFGPSESGRKPGTCGHEEIEMALIELSRDTGEKRYLDQAKYFLDARGHRLIGGGEYHQDHKPVRELDRVTGHAVRMMYLACGMTDLCLETDDAAMRAALDRIWSNMTQRQLYITGGVGSRYEGEAFGRDYELPNERAYTETCAAIGSIMWNWRMLQMAQSPSEAARYADLIELTLFNGFLSGLSLDGKTYFYQNPLADDGTHRREPWFGCACCPPNVARLLASLPGYFYSAAADGVWVHQFATNRAKTALPDGRTIEIEQQANYPWDADIAITVQTAGRFAVHARIPGWCDGSGDRGAAATVGGERLDVSSQRGSYLRVERDWKAGDVLHLHLPMPVKFVESHPYVTENAGRVAIMRGPLVYCIEAVDNGGGDIRGMSVLSGAQPSGGSSMGQTIGQATDQAMGGAMWQAGQAVWKADLLGGVTTIRLPAVVEVATPDSLRLYQPAGDGRALASERRAAEGRAVDGRASGGAAEGRASDGPVSGASVSSPETFSRSLVFVPYYAWANRQPGRMLAWVRRHG